VDNGFVRQTLNAGGVQFSYHDNGARDVATVVVLLHGISSGAASWSATAAALGDAKLRVLAWDAPGYGDSSNLPQQAPTASHYAQRLKLWLDALHVESCVLLGHSLGALMAAAFAQQYPAHVRALLLASPAIGYGDTPRADEIRQNRLAGLQQGIEVLAEHLPERLLSANASAAQREQVRDVARQLHTRGYAQAVEMLCSENLYRHAPLSIPTRVCCGEHDIVTPQQQSRACADHLGAPFKLIANAGHACPVEQGAALAHILEEWIDEIQLSETRSHTTESA